MGTVNKDAVLDIIQKLPDVHMIGLICRDEVIDEITALPSAQPEIIRCKDCKHYQETTLSYNDGSPVYDCPYSYGWAKEDGFCDMAERREDENR